MKLQGPKRWIKNTLRIAGLLGLYRTVHQWCNLDPLIPRPQSPVKEKTPSPSPSAELQSEPTSPPKGIRTHLSQSGFYAIPAKRTVLFWNQNYYHFYYLSQALQRRNWDTLLVSTTNPESAEYMYYHGESINLYDSNPKQFQQNIQHFYDLAKQRYRLFHFSGDGCMAFFPQNRKLDDPPDIVEWKSVGNKIAYTVSGCLSATSQTAFHQWSKGNREYSACDRCRWQDNPKVCNDEKNLAWGAKVDKYCDVVFAENLPALNYISKSYVIREPMTACLDPIVWHPDLAVPNDAQIQRTTDDEILVYHAVGNYDSRTDAEGRNIKGTPAIFAAIERLKLEGYPIRLIFETNKPNKLLRFTQVQADIAIDQLNLGRNGATGRECMMLGIPTICYLNLNEPEGHSPPQHIKESPMVSATEETFYEVLKSLVESSSRRKELSLASREFALKWFSADACAHRYEQVYDHLMAYGEIGPFPKTWNYFNPNAQLAHSSNAPIHFV